MNRKLIKNKSNKNKYLVLTIYNGKCEPGFSTIYQTETIPVKLNIIIIEKSSTELKVRML